MVCGEVHSGKCARLTVAVLCEEGWGSCTIRSRQLYNLSCFTCKIMRSLFEWVENPASHAGLECVDGLRDLSELENTGRLLIIFGR